MARVHCRIIGTAAEIYLTYIRSVRQQILSLIAAITSNATTPGTKTANAGECPVLPVAQLQVTVLGFPNSVRWPLIAFSAGSAKKPEISFTCHD